MCCWCCCKQKKSQASTAPAPDDVTVSPIFGPITTQPARGNVTAIRLPSVTTITMQHAATENCSAPKPTITSITTRLPGVEYVTGRPSAITSITRSSPPLIVTDTRLRSRDPLAVAGLLTGPGTNMAATAAVPTAPPPPGVTEHCWTKTKLAHTEPSVGLGDGLYVGRVVSGQHTLPAILETCRFVEPHSGVVVEQFVAANFFYKDQAGCTEDFEVLSCSRTGWRSALGGHVAPEAAIVCGRAAGGRPLYLGRAFDEGAFHYGTADPEDGLLYSAARAAAGSWYGCVRTSTHFDILVAA